MIYLMFSISKSHIPALNKVMKQSVNYCYSVRMILSSCSFPEENDSELLRDVNSWNKTYENKCRGYL